MAFALLFAFLLFNSAYGTENATTTALSTDSATTLTPMITTEISTDCENIENNSTIPSSCITSTSVAVTSTQNANNSVQISTPISHINTTTQPSEVNATFTNISPLHTTVYSTVTEESIQETTFTSPVTFLQTITASSNNETETTTDEIDINTTTASALTTSVTDSLTTQNIEVTTSSMPSNVTTATTYPTIVQRIKDIWNESLEKLNFSSTYLNETEMLGITSSGLINIMVEYFLMSNVTELEVKVKDSGITDLAAQILIEKPTLLESEIREEFNSSQNITLHVLFSTLYWFHDEVLSNIVNFQHLSESYTPPSTSSGNNGTGNSTLSDATPAGFIGYIINNANESSLQDSICKVAKNEEIVQSICSTISPPTTAASSLPGPEIFESTWNSIVSDVNYSFVSAAQVQQLQSITPKNMTTALINYVKEMTNDEIKNLVDLNVTQYVNNLLRKNGRQVVDTIGEEAVREFAGSSDREDVYYVYSNLLNKLFSNTTKFEEIIRGYINSSPPARRRRSISDCDLSTINPGGICCYTIVTEGSDAEALRDAVCEELNGGNECMDSFTIVEENELQSTTATIIPISHGLTTWEIVGIALGAFFALLLLFLLLFFVWKRCIRRKSKVNPQANSQHSSSEMEERMSHGSTREQALSNGHTSRSTASSANP
ncbi:uncharacterized protein LOC120327871 [Styela clava]